jgi:hypothetical protein
VGALPFPAGGDILALNRAGDANRLDDVGPPFRQIQKAACLEHLDLALSWRLRRLLPVSTWQSSGSCRVGRASNAAARLGWLPLTCSSASPPDAFTASMVLIWQCMASAVQSTPARPSSRTSACIAGISLLFTRIATCPRMIFVPMANALSNCDIFLSPAVS